MFEDQTQAVILDRMMSKIDSIAGQPVDKRQGSVAKDMSTLLAIESELIYAELDNVLNFGFAGTTYGPYLERRVAEVGLTRKAAITATGQVTFSGEVGRDIGAGTQVSTEGDEPIIFQTLATATIDSSGSVTVDAVAVTGGSEGNVNAGAIAIIIGDLSGLITVTNAEAFSGGVAAESDEDLLIRYYDRVRNNGAAGSSSDFRNWALEIINIGDARVFPLWDGPGTVKVVLLGTNRRTPSSALVQQVAEYIESVRPICAEVTVVGATEIPIDIRVSLTLKANGVLANAITQIQENVTEYLKALAFTDLIVRYTKIADCVLNAEDVLDYANLTVNFGTSNIQIDTDEVAVLGAVVNT